MRLELHQRVTAGCLALSLSLLASTTASAAALPSVSRERDFGGQASWSVPKYGDVRKASLAWLAEQKIDASLAQQAELIWPTSAAVSGDGLLARVAATLVIGDPRARQLVELCTSANPPLAPPTFDWLTDERTPPFARCNLRLLHARWLAQERFYDESLAALGELKPEEVVDPAGLLFYQALAHHQMLDRERGLAAINRLLERKDDIPRRYASLARLMQVDLEALEDESLDHIARRMDDIRRRLDLGRGGKDVRKRQDGVIASLDKLIEEIEKQQQQAAANSQGSSRSSSPAQDSVPLGGKGPGDVAKRPIGEKSGWGDLPAKQREEVLQQIGQEFPAHYRDLIEQFFRKRASEGEEKP